MSVTELKKQFKAQVEKLMVEVSSDKEAQNKYYDNLDMLQRKRLAAGMTMTDTNFLQKNLELASDMGTQRMRQM